MLTYDKNNGFYYHNDDRHYHLYEMKAYLSDKTSDILVIFDHDRDTVVNHVYGATTIRPDELDRIVTEYVQQYERELRTPKAPEPDEVNEYKFNKLGVKGFMSDAFECIYEALEDDSIKFPEIEIKVRDRKITIPILRQTWEHFERFMPDALEEWEEA
jgi:hypothetical protein